jgi:hypothetical protein
MGNLRTSTSNLAQEQAIIFRVIERLRIAEDFHDRVAPEFLVAIFQLNQIQMDLESRSLPESGDIQKVSDRISAGIHELLAVLNPPNEEVQQADSNLN